MTENFSIQQIEQAAQQFLKFGEQTYKDENHGGYFSGNGWAARCLRHFKNEKIKEYKKLLSALIEIVGRMSLADLEEILEKNKAEFVNSWYFENRDRNEYK